MYDVSFHFQAKVNFVFSGHAHQYERSYPVYQHQASPTAPVYFLIGNGGTGVGNKWIDLPSFPAATAANNNAACLGITPTTVNATSGLTAWGFDKSFYYPVNATVNAIQVWGLALRTNVVAR